MPDTFGLTTGLRMLRAVFADSFLFNLTLFVLGQVVAYLYLRTGRRPRGMALMFGGWILADVALLLRFVFEFEANRGAYMLCLSALQVWSCLEIICYVHGRWRRRLKSHRQLREKEFERGYLCYLRNDLEPAMQAFQKLLRRDPWDLQVTLALATACARAGRDLRAKNLLRTARYLDVDGSWADAIAAEQARFKVAPKPRKPIKLKPKKAAKDKAKPASKLKPPSKAKQSGKAR